MQCLLTIPRIAPVGARTTARWMSKSSGAAGRVITAVDHDFRSVLEAESSGKTVLVDFHADWCGPCRMLAPVLQKAMQATDDKPATTLIKVNVDEAQQTAAQYQIAALPTVAAFRDGKKLASFTGLRDERFVRGFISDNS